MPVKYILVGKQVCTLKGIKDFLNARDIFVCNNVKELNSLKDTQCKVIYIHTPLKLSYDWWLSGGLNNSFCQEKFIEETILFSQLSDEQYDLCLEYDGSDITGIIDSINVFISETENNK